MDVSGAVYDTQADELPSSRAQIRALISEIWMLVDYVAGSSSQGLNAVEVPNALKAGSKLTPAELLQVVSDTEERIAAGAGAIQPYDRAQMQIVRDALNVLVRPASGLTVAYTTMFVGPLRRRAASRVNLAQDAYSNLAGTADWHRRWQNLILVLTIAFTLMAALESAKVAFGKALLQNLDLLRAEQAALSAEKVKVELSLDTPAAASLRLDEDAGSSSSQLPPVTSYRLCDRALVRFARTQLPPAFIHQGKSDIPPLSYATAEERDVCGRDYILMTNLGIVRVELQRYGRNWAGLEGSVLAPPGSPAASRQPPADDAGPTGSDDGQKDNSQKDLEFAIVPMLLVIGNFALPVLFGLIGSAIFVILDNYLKTRDSTLHPRDFFLAWVRLALGLVVGACVGLFSSSYAPVQPVAGTQNASALIATLTLSASGVAFLAGFGVEAVFSRLQSLVNRIFTLPAQAK